jgi:hypothetical protein
MLRVCIAGLRLNIVQTMEGYRVDGIKSMAFDFCCGPHRRCKRRNKAQVFCC